MKALQIRLCFGPISAGESSIGQQILLLYIVLYTIMRIIGIMIEIFQYFNILLEDDALAALARSSDCSPMI